jgi:hypothetical protein
MFVALRSSVLTAPLLALALVSCNCYEQCTVRACGPDVTETRPITDIARLNVTANTDVYLTQGATPSLRLEAPRNILDALRTETIGGELRIGPANGVDLKTKHPVRIYVTLPTLTALNGSGATNFHSSTTWNIADLVLTLSGASTADFSVAATGTLLSDASGASRALLRGTTARHTVRLSGASALDAFDLSHAAADLDVSGASNARLSVTTSLAVRASGASEVYYQGAPTITATDVSGASRLVKVN